MEKNLMNIIVATWLIISIIGLIITLFIDVLLGIDTDRGNIFSWVLSNCLLSAGAFVLLAALS